MLRILLMRHACGAGDGFARPASPVSGFLSEDRGLRQAAAAARALNQTPIHVAFASSYGRALQTAETVLAGRGIPIRVLDFLREWQPSALASAASPAEYEQMLAREGERYVEETWKTELGEGCFEMYARIIPPFLAELARIGVHSRMGGYALDPAAENLNVAVFAHSGSLNVILSHLLGLRPFPFASFLFSETGLATIVFNERRGIHYPSMVIPPASGEPEGVP